MVDVYWTVNSYSDFDILHNEPIHYLSYIKQSEKTIYSHMSCPAFNDYYKNVYIITSPFDLTIRIDKNNDFYLDEKDLPKKNFIDARNEFSRVYIKKQNDCLRMMTLFFQYIFIGHKSCMMESIPLTSDINSLSDLIPICGTFNINKWIRPVDFTFLVRNNVSSIEIKKDQPLFCVRFNVDQKINLVKIDLHSKSRDKILKIITDCANYKNYVPGRKMYYLYERFSNYVNMKNFIKEIKKDVS